MSSALSLMCMEIMVSKDAMAYISLFLAIRSGDWHLLIVSLKKMVPCLLPISAYSLP